MAKVAIVYHSGYGHTELQAKAVHEGAAGVDGVEAVLLTAEDAQKDLELLADADAIVFGAPTYMGSASGPMKTFMDATSKVWAKKGWKDKLAGGFTNSGSPSGDKVVTLTQFAVLAAQHAMVWVSNGEGNQTQSPDYDGPNEAAVNRLGGYLGPMSQSANAPAGPGNPPEGDIETARLYGRRMALAALRWGRGLIEEA
jgi:multimeric flavodoxin WrbA